MNTQTNKEAGPAVSAVTDGKINIPHPKTAPIVNAVPCIQVIERCNSGNMMPPLPLMALL
ncbi:hypothetical protein [Bacillus subtilis]|uniref:hypothetical protein n=1 Tax=Bacillus subtilis TaxID=1423 RepID=UPI003AF021C3